MLSADWSIILPPLPHHRPVPRHPLQRKAAGMKPEDDRLPKRLIEEPISSGPSKGMTSQINVTLPQYYEARGWENAFPTQATLERLGLAE